VPPEYEPILAQNGQKSKPEHFSVVRNPFSCYDVTVKAAQVLFGLAVHAQMLSL
jgi:hypothetical protein